MGYNRASVFESLFRFLFKYERLVFEQGQFVLGATQSMWLVAAIAAAAALYVALDLSAADGPQRARPRRAARRRASRFWPSRSSRVLRPMLLLKVAVPQQNFVGILLDDSRSMQVADEAGQAAQPSSCASQLGRPDAPLLTALGKRFVPRVFRFSVVGRAAAVARPT